jgi:hypothetical protein
MSTGDARMASLLREEDCDESIFPRRLSLSPRTRDTKFDESPPRRLSLSPRTRDTKFDRSSPSLSPGGHSALLETPLPRFVARVSDATEPSVAGSVRVAAPATDSGIFATPAPSDFERYATNSGDTFLFSPQSGAIVWDDWNASVGRYVPSTDAAPPTLNERASRVAQVRFAPDGESAAARTRGAPGISAASAPQISTALLVCSTAAVVFLDARLRALGLHWAVRLAALVFCVCTGGLLEEGRRRKSENASMVHLAQETRDESGGGEGPIERRARVRNAGHTPHPRRAIPATPGVSDAQAAAQVERSAGRSPNSRAREMEEIAVQQREIASTQAQIAALVAAADMFGAAAPLSSPFAGAHADAVAALRDEVRALQDEVQRQQRDIEARTEVHNETTEFIVAAHAEEVDDLQSLLVQSVAMLGLGGDGDASALEVAALRDAGAAAAALRDATPLGERSRVGPTAGAACDAERAVGTAAAGGRRESACPPPAWLSTIATGMRCADAYTAPTGNAQPRFVEIYGEVHGLTSRLARRAFHDACTKRGHADTNIYAFTRPVLSAFREANDAAGRLRVLASVASLFTQGVGSFPADETLIFGRLVEFTRVLADCADPRFYWFPIAFLLHKHAAIALPWPAQIPPERRPCRKWKHEIAPTLIARDAKRLAMLIACVSRLAVSTRAALAPRCDCLSASARVPVLTPTPRTPASTANCPLLAPADAGTSIRCASKPIAIGAESASTKRGTRGAWTQTSQTRRSRRCRRVNAFSSRKCCSKRTGPSASPRRVGCAVAERTSSWCD